MPPEVEDHHLALIIAQFERPAIEVLVTDFRGHFAHGQVRQVSQPSQFGGCQIAEFRLAVGSVDVREVLGRLGVAALRFG